MKYLMIISFSLSLLLYGCGGSGGSSTPVPADLAGFTMSDFSGTSVSRATRVDGGGKVVEEGDVINGTKSGTWVSYYPEDGRVKSVTTYVNGLKNGIHMELNNRGQIELQCGYKDDQLHGPWGKYKFGSRPEKLIDYNMGKIDGAYREYHSNGKIQKEIFYKNGVQHGTFKQYNDEEKLIMEYEYKNGEKVSGGIVTAPEEE